MTKSLPIFPTDLSTLSAEQLRELVLQSQVALGEKDAIIAQKETVIAQTAAAITQKEQTNKRLNLKINQLTMELATLRRINFAKRSEQLPDLQARLFEEDALTDIAEVEAKLDSLRQELAGGAEAAKVKPKTSTGVRLPAELPTVEIRHDLESTDCTCGCAMRHIGDDVSQKLDYTPGTFTVENHLRPKYVCDECKTLNQAPVPAHVIDKGLATTGLLASVLVMKYADHLPLYRQATIFERAGLRIARSTLAGWVGQCGAQLEPLVDALREQVLSHSVLHADETPLNYHNHQKKEVKRGYVWAYAPGEFESLKAIIYDFKPGRSGAYAREFLGDWRGSLMCDDYAGYKALFASGQVIEGGCWAHARRKFHAIYEANNSPVAEQALRQIQLLYQHEAMAKALSPPERLTYRHEHMRPVLDAFDTWLRAQQTLVPPNSAIAKAIQYTVNNWTALTRLLDNAQMPIDNNAVENLIRPLAIGRKNWLFAGSEIAGRRGAAIMSLIHSARLNGLDPQAYLRDVLERLPTHKAKDIDELLPHRWRAPLNKQ